MKKIISTILLLAILVPNLGLAAPYAKFGGPFGSFQIGNNDGGSLTSDVLDVNWAFGASGEMNGVQFISPRTQTSNTFKLHVYCSAITGTPNESIAIIYPGPTGATDPQRPDSTAVATSTNTDVSATGCTAVANSWVTYTFTAALTQNKTYFVGVVNTEAAPLTDNFSLVTRGTADTNGSFDSRGFRGFESNDGFLTDPTAANAIMAPMVIEFADGTVFGNPWVGSANATNNANSRGVRVSLSGAWNLSGYNLSVVDAGNLIASSSVYQGSTLLSDVPVDRYQVQNGVVHFLDPLVLSAGTYDVIARYSGADNSGTIFTMGINPPASILALNNLQYVNGTAGSFTASTTATMAMSLFLDDIPAAVGGGGSGSANIKVNGRLIIQ